MRKSNTSSNLEKFGTVLHEARIAAGYPSLAKGVEAINERSSNRKFSRSSLHLVEKGRIADIDPSLIRAIAATYELDSDDLMRQYLQERFEVPLLAVNLKSKIVEDETEDFLRLKAPGDQAIEIISLKCFERIQSKVEKNSIIAISATSFLDDDLFFEMVSQNIKNGVTYYYHLQSNTELRYRSFVSDLAKVLRKDVQDIDGKCTHFIHRGISEFPLNAVLHISPTHSINGFIGLTLEEQVLYYQRADSVTSWRLYQALLLAIALGRNQKAQSMRLEVSNELAKMKDVIGFPVLLRGLE